MTTKGPEHTGVVHTMRVWEDAVRLTRHGVPRMETRRSAAGDPKLAPSTITVAEVTGGGTPESYTGKPLASAREQSMEASPRVRVTAMLNTRGRPYLQCA